MRFGGSRNFVDACSQPSALGVVKPIRNGDPGSLVVAQVEVEAVLAEPANHGGGTTQIAVNFHDHLIRPVQPAQISLLPFIAAVYRELAVLDIHLQLPGSRRDSAASQGDLHVNPFADTDVRGEAPNLRLEVLLCLDRDGLGDRQRSPDGEEPGISTEIESHPVRGITNSVRRYRFRQYISLAPTV
jgi:hypothetical protein